jgi:hypothetical protein
MRHEKVWWEVRMWRTVLREMELNMFLISRRSIAWEGGRLAWRGREM